MVTFTLYKHRREGPSNQVRIVWTACLVEPGNCSSFLKTQCHPENMPPRQMATRTLFLQGWLSTQATFTQIFVLLVRAPRLSVCLLLYTTTSTSCAKEALYPLSSMTCFEVRMNRHWVKKAKSATSTPSNPSRYLGSRFSDKSRYCHAKL